MIQPLWRTVWRFLKKLGIKLPSVQSVSSVTQSCLTLCNPTNHSTAGLPVHHHLREFTQTHVHRVSDAIQPSHPRSSPSPTALKSLPASESFPMSWLFALGGFSFSISSSNEYSGLISFRMDWFDLLVIQETLKSLLQHQIQKHQFFGTQLSLQS